MIALLIFSAMMSSVAVSGKQKSMRSSGVADWDGERLHEYRCLPTDFYKDEYFRDDEALLPPVLLPRDLVEVDYLPTTEPLDLEAPVYRTKTLSLGNEVLPVYAERYKIADTVLKNTFTFIKTETGSGKSTQVPQILHDTSLFNTIIVTQPRRMAARNVFERIRYELGTKLGEDAAAQLTSFQTAGERSGPNDAKIKVVTDGLEVARQADDGAIAEGDVIIIDELHEDNENIEILFAWAKRAGARNPNLRFVFLSATIDAADRAHYLEEATGQPVPIIEIAGRQHSIEMREEPESDAVTQTLKAAAEIYDQQQEAVTEFNRILVFVPGKGEIEDTIDQIRKRLPPHIVKLAHIHPLHAKLSPAQQQAAIAKYPGIAITVATEVAETSLTVEGVKYVVDSGYSRRIEIDQEGVRGLMLRPISKAACRQRAGRAGRLVDGIYIATRLNAETDYMSYEDREDYPMPAILRADLARTTLRLAARGFNIAMFDFYHTVKPEAIERAQSLLRMLGALDIDNGITDMGRRMDEFPVCATSARMLIEAESKKLPQQTRAYLAAMVAAKEVGGLPYFARGVSKRWEELTEETSSDMLVQLDILTGVQDMDLKQLAELDLDVQNVVRAREQYQKIAKKISAYKPILAPPTEAERNKLKECIYAGQIGSMFMHIGAGKYRHLGGTATERSISRRSRVTGRPEALVGDMYRIEYWKDGERFTDNIVEHPTGATLRDLGKVASHLVQIEHGEIVYRDGTFKQKTKKLLHGVDLKEPSEVLASPDVPGYQETLIDFALENPGDNQKALRKVKKQLEEYRRIAKDYVPQITHDELKELLREATSGGITEPWEIDSKLGYLMQSKNLYLDTYLSAQRRSQIERDAPKVIVAEDVTLLIKYSNSQPSIVGYDKHDIVELTEEIFLEDGRQVYFAHGSQRYTLTQIKRKLEIKQYA